MYIRRESSVQGPLNPLQIKDIVISKYRAVRKLFFFIIFNEIMFTYQIWHQLYQMFVEFWELAFFLCDFFVSISRELYWYSTMIRHRSKHALSQERAHKLSRDLGIN